MVFREIIVSLGMVNLHTEWPELVIHLTEGIKCDNDQIILNILETFNTTFKKYRHLFRSDGLYSEMNFIIQTACPIMFEKAKVSEVIS
jgi:hypothetical protein